MNIKDTRINKDAARYVLLGAIAVLGILVNAVFYAVFLKAQGKSNSLLSARRAEYESLWKKYENFAEISAEMKGTAAKAREIARANAMFLAGNDDKGRLSMSEMESIQVKAGINIDRFSPGKGTLGVDFRAPFAKTAGFLSRLESVFVVDKIQISGDEKAQEANHSASVSVAMITPAEPSGTLPSEIFALYDRSKAVIGDIEASTRVSVSTGPLKDPFLARGTILPIEPPKPRFKPKPKPVQPPDIVIESIVWDEANPLVIVKGKIYREGEVIEGGAKIVKIHRTMVTVNWQSVDFDILRAQKETQ